MKKKLVSILALLMVILMAGTAFVGCGSKNSAEKGNTESASKSQVLTFAQTAEIPSLDPQLMNSMQSAEVANAIFEGLVRLHDGKVQPGMAEKWDISSDGKTYTFHLRDAKWSDGQPVTAYNFEYGIRRLLNPKTSSPYAFAGYCILNGYEYNSGKITDVNQLGVKAIDEKTLEIKLTNPAAYFLGYLSLACFMPTREDIVEKYGNNFALEAENNVYNGPFILKEWKHESGVTLEKNPDYWNKDAIKLDKVNILQITDPNTALSMYENGELDFVSIPNALWDKYKDNPKVKLIMNGAVDWLRLNLNAPGKPWLANEDFRKALNYAINREEYVNTATKGLYLPYTRLVLPMVAGAKGGKYTEECPIDIYPKTGDAAKAKEYLAKAMSALNIKDPKDITLELKFSDSAADKALAEVLQDQLTRNLGIAVTIKLVTYKQKLADDTAKQYDAVYNGWMPDYDDPMTYLELFESNNSQNSTGWSNAEFDKLIEAARTEADAVKRQQYFWDAEKILVEECPFVPLQCRQVGYLEKDNLKGMSRYFIGSDLDFVFAYFE
ncbi:MAG: ABC transporter substrate-binding protein [Tepidanaerobacteraceae bacterium]|jgi:oligopeptide transport system substrate-binding protein|nr:ABC transporter substrate-binding protein [Tepidanaerobacteraceae bacterium]